MAKSKKKLSLHIQNDQTGTSNVSQRNSDLALVLQGPGGIEHFTNFNDRVISLSSTTPPLSAFTSSPYHKNAESVFGNIKGKYPSDTPSDIKILDDIAIVSYKDHSQKVYLANTPLNNAVPKGDKFFIIRKEYTIGYESTTTVYTLQTGLVFKNVGISDAKQFDFLTSNAGNSSAFNFTLVDGNSSTPSVLTKTEYSIESDITRQEIKRDSSITSLSNYNSDVDIIFFPTEDRMARIKDTDEKGLVVKFSPTDGNLEDLASEGRTIFSHTDINNSAKIISYIKVSFDVSPDSYFAKTGVHNRCGRVDIFERRKGLVTAVDGNKITISGPTGDGTYDTKLLQDGDIIKISCGLNSDTSLAYKNDINGIKYVQRINDTQYFIYNDEDMYEPTNTSGLRTTDGVVWTHYGSTQELTGSWRYYTTLFSPNGLNGQSVFKGDMLIPTDATLSAPSSETIVDYDGDSIVADKYRFGQCVDVIRQSGQDFYWLAISELGAPYSCIKGIDYYGNIKEVKPEPIETVTAVGDTTTVYKTYDNQAGGFKFVEPDTKPYGKVFLYKINMSGDFISSVGDAEQIDASTTNPYVNEAPFQNSGVDFEAFTDFKNLYWYRAAIANALVDPEAVVKSTSGIPLKDAILDDEYFITQDGSRRAEFRRNIDSSNFYRDKVLEYVRDNTSPYFSKQNAISIKWFTDGYKFADGFGYSFALKANKEDDNITGAELKPIIAVANRTFPFAASVSKSIDDQLESLKQLASGEVNTLEFVELNSKSNQSIIEFCREPGNSYRCGSIFIYNPNQSINTKTLRHSTRLREKLAEDNYLQSNSILSRYSNIVGWYGKPFSMFYKDDMLIAGTDGSGIKIFKEKDSVVSQYETSVATGLNSYSLDISEYTGTLSDGDERFTDYDEDHIDLFNISNSNTNLPSSVLNCWKFSKTYSAESDSTFPSDSGTKSISKDYDEITISSDSTIVPFMMYPDLTPDFSVAKQSQSSTRTEYESANILLRTPFGHNFRYDDRIITLNAASYVNEFDITGSDILHRLYVYEVNNNNTTSLIQRITPAVSKEVAPADRGTSSDFSYTKYVREGSTTFSENYNNSLSISYLMDDMFDILKGKIVLKTPLGHAVFSDSGRRPLLDFVSTERNNFVNPYFSFLESFNPKKPYDLNSIYTYKEGAGISYDETISDVNEEHRGMCLFYNIEDKTFREQTVRKLIGADFTLDISDNITMRGNTLVSDDSSSLRVLPKLSLLFKDPRSSITQKGNVAGRKLDYGASTATRSPLYVEGLQDAESVTVAPAYQKSTEVTGNESWRGTYSFGAADLFKFIGGGSELKDSSNNRTFRYNDGKGNATTAGDVNTYVLSFDDVAKPSFDSSISIEGTLIISITSQENSTSSNSYRQKWSSDMRREELNYVPYSIPYSDGPNQHAFVNKVKIASTKMTYRDYALGVVRRYSCATYNESLSSRLDQALSSESTPTGETPGIIRMGSSKSAALFDEPNTSSVGTFSDSLQILYFNSDGTYEGLSPHGLIGSGNLDRYGNFDVQKPEGLSLTMRSYPTIDAESE